MKLPLFLLPIVVSSLAVDASGGDPKKLAKRFDDNWGYTKTDLVLNDLVLNDNLYVKISAYSVKRQGLTLPVKEMMNVCNTCPHAGTCEDGVRELISAVTFVATSIMGDLEGFVEVNDTVTKNVLASMQNAWEHKGYIVKEVKPATLGNKYIQGSGQKLAYVGYVTLKDANNSEARSHVYVASGKIQSRFEVVNAGTGNGFPVCKGSVITDFGHRTDLYGVRQSAIESMLNTINRHEVPDSIGAGNSYSGETAEFWRVYKEDPSAFLMGWRSYYQPPDDYIYWAGDVVHFG